jgi:excisionase family DNA binding protein
MRTLAAQEAPLALSIKEACALSSIGRTKIYEVISEGKLRAHKCGRRTFIFYADLMEFLETLPVVGEVS